MKFSGNSRLVAFLLATAVVTAGNAGAQGTITELTFTPHDGGVRQPQPPGLDELAVDDGTFEGTVGIGLQTARQFLWFNRFTLPGTPYRLDQVWVMFPQTVAVGSSVQLAVWHDPDGDPTNGATLLWTQDVTVQVADDLTFSIYPVSPSLLVTDPGDLLIGVVDRFVTSGVTPAIEPAILDTTASQGRSWIVQYSGDPPDPPTLPGDGAITLVDAFEAGNWMIRGYGEAGVPEPGIPTTGRTGALAMMVLVACAGWWLATRRRA